MMSKGIGFMNDIKLDVTLDELYLISIALNAYQMETDNYHLNEIKSLKDRVNALVFKEQEKVEKNKAKQPTPDW